MTLAGRNWHACVLIRPDCVKTRMRVDLPWRIEKIIGAFRSPLAGQETCAATSVVLIAPCRENEHGSQAKKTAEVGFSTARL